MASFDSVRKVLRPESMAAAVRILRSAIAPRINLAAAFTAAGLIAKYKELIAEITWRDISSGHARQSLGTYWVFAHPIVVVLVYLFIFGFVLGSRINKVGDFPGDYPSYILIGLVPWLVMQSALTRATGALVNNANLVKQVVFPIETLPIAGTLAAFVPYVPAFGLVLAYKGFFAGGLGWTIVLMPLVLLIHGATALGLSFALAATTAFLRDFRELVAVFCVLAMYFTPAIYLPDWVPVAFRPLLYLNPFSYLTWVYQDMLFYGHILHPIAWLVAAILATGSLGLGFRLFEKLKPYYGNVL